MLYVVIYGIKCILSYWYPAFKKAVEVGIGITFLISMANFFITVTLKNFANTLPRVGIYLEPVLISIPSGLAGFILLAFYLAVYRDKTRKMEDKDVDIFESPGEFV